MVSAARIVILACCTTLAATWLMAMFVQQSGTSAMSRTIAFCSEEGDMWEVRENRRSMTSRLYWKPMTGDARLTGDDPPAWSIARCNPPTAAECNEALYVEVGWGWPFIAASYQYRRLGTSWGDLTTPVRGGIDLGIKPDWFGTLGLATHEVLALPTRPSWIGTLINTALASLAWAALCHGPRSIRALWWRSRACCMFCGYDLRGTDGRCPECGVSAGTKALTDGKSEARDRRRNQT